MSNMSSLGFNPKYDDKKLENEIYVGKLNKNSFSDSTYRSVSVIIPEEVGLVTEKNQKVEELQRKYIDDNDSDFVSEKVEFNVVKEIILETSPSGQQKISCWLLDDKGRKSIRGLHIARRTKKGVYSNEEVTLSPKGIVALKKFLETIPIIDNKKVEPYKIPLVKDDIEYQKILTSDEFEELIKENITNIDDFYKILLIKKMQIGIDKLEQIISGEYKNEVDIQKFLKENMWMFPNNYSLVVDDVKINKDNIFDIIPKDIEGFVDIIEVKLPNVQLFHYDNSHNNYYSSSTLTKAIAQTQNYIFEFEKKANDPNYQDRNNCKIVKPRGIILIGSGNPLTEDEIKYLRILNSSFHNIYILTYQQLLDRAKMIFEIGN